MSVSFIQICRNYLRSNSFCCEKVLEGLYKSGIGMFTYPNCKAVDFAASIRATSYDGSVSYHPLLVSVKNWWTVVTSNVYDWKTDMEKLLKDMRGENKSNKTPAACCLIFLVGCHKPPDLDNNQFGTTLENFPQEDFYRFICIPEKDKFGVTNAIVELGCASEVAEVYASHAFLANEESSSTKSLLRSKTNIEAKVGELLKAMKQET
mmetsp:Transcript_27500/g.38850  ORF Transcript_27500/g.38850 Transcript_27500/m.38850 type:complete len:207 (+) Transcript_27500:714-1334(+)